MPFLPKDILSYIFLFQSDYKYFRDENKLVSLLLLNKCVRPPMFTMEFFGFNATQTMNGNFSRTLKINKHKEYLIEFDNSAFPSQYRFYISLLKNDTFIEHFKTVNNQTWINLFEKKRKRSDGPHFN
jgi:hypothetical protein